MHQVTFPPTVKEGSLFSTTPPLFIICRLYDDGHPDQCDIPHYDFFTYLIIDNVEHIFMCRWVIHVSSLQISLFRSAAHCLIGLSVFLFLFFFFLHGVVLVVCIYWKLIPCWLLKYWIYSYSLYWIYWKMFENIFSLTRGCLFDLLMASFALQKLLILIRPHLFIFAFISFALGDLRKIATIYVRMCFLCSKSFMVLSYF